MHQHIGPHYSRVRIGVGHPGHKDRVAGYVLHDFAKADLDWLDDTLRGISDGAADLAAGDTGRFLNAVGLRRNPAKEAKPAKPKPNPAPSEPSADTADRRNPMQKLIDRFR